MDKTDMMYKRKKFFKIVFPQIQEGEYIRIFQANEDVTKVEFFNNIDDMNNYINNNRFNINTYFNLSTTAGESGQEQDLKTRSVIAFDFDKKDLGENFSHKDIIKRLKQLNLWYHCLVDSGHGFHAYMCIEPTTDIQKVVEVTKVIGKRLGADMNAMKSTQVLRVPYTFNVKDKPKQVNILHMFDKDTIKRYSVEKLYNRFCCNAKDKEIGDRATQFVLNNTNIPKCVIDILYNGSRDGDKNKDLQRIVVTLRDRNKSINDITHICREWNNKSEDKYNEHELKYQVKYMYENIHGYDYQCGECKYKSECFNKIQSDFEYSDKEKIIQVTESHMKYLKQSNRRGAKIMKGNELLIYGILKNNNDGMSRDDIIHDLTYKSKKKKVEKCTLSKNTLTGALKNLEENGFITSEGMPKIYKLKDIRSKVELTYNISMSAVYECVKDNISTEELRLYCYMRYLHHKEQRENPKALKGNLFQFNQVDLAKELGVTQGRISQMIDNLLDEKLLGIWYRQQSKNNGFDFNIYRLNY